MLRKIVLGSTVATAAFGLLAAPASADHVHSKEVGNGSCVLLAQKGGERFVVLPNVGGLLNRRHPLHALVHLGEPGENFDIGVYGTSSDPCIGTGDYLND